jgi:hypothetical protein
MTTCTASPTSCASKYITINITNSMAISSLHLLHASA